MREESFNNTFEMDIDISECLLLSKVFFLCLLKKL